MPTGVRSLYEQRMNEYTAQEGVQEKGACAAPFVTESVQKTKDLGSRLVKSDIASVLTTTVQKMAAEVARLKESPIMGEPQSLRNLLHDGANLPALESLERSFKGASIRMGPQAIFRALAAGVMWANCHIDVEHRYTEVIRELGLKEYGRVFDSMDRFLQKSVFVHDVMNDSVVSDEWVSFFQQAARVWTNVHGAARGDGMELQALSQINQRPIAIIDGEKTARSGKISGLCFSEGKRKEFAVESELDFRSQFHGRTLFVLVEKGQCIVLFSGEEPAKAGTH